MKTCPSCGKITEQRRNYCPHCGAPLLPSGKAPDPEAAAQKKKALKKRLSIALLLLFLLGLGILLLFHTPSPRYREAGDLGSAYLRLYIDGNDKELAALFPKQLRQAWGVENPDPYRFTYGLQLSPLGVYDVTASSELSKESVNKELTIDYGLKPLAEDYARLLVGGVVNDTDLWFQLDMIKIGSFWYLYRVS